MNHVFEFAENGIGQLHLGDCRSVLRTLPDSSVDSVVTDPPAGIAFMGKAWDRFTREQFIAFLTEIMAECFRVAKPGAYSLVWALPRTSHWTGMAIEDAGWVIQDRISHIFGQGFPKHRSKLKPACEDWWLAWKPDRCVTPLPGLDACRIATEESLQGSTVRNDIRGGNYANGHVPNPGDIPDYKQNSQGRWPANVTLEHLPECVCVGTKKVKSSNFEGHPEGRKNSVLGKDHRPRPAAGFADADGMEVVESWQCADGCPVKMLDEQSGQLTSGYSPPGAQRKDSKGGGGYHGDMPDSYTLNGTHGDTGGASRFFYVAKASRGERNDGCEDMEEARGGGQSNSIVAGRKEPEKTVSRCARTAIQRLSRLT